MCRWGENNGQGERQQEYIARACPKLTFLARVGDVERNKWQNNYSRRISEQYYAL
jgi:hypothetical protein